MAFRRHGAAITGRAEVVRALRAPLEAFRQARKVGGKVVEHPVHEAIVPRGDQGRVRIVADHRQTFRARREVLPRERRRAVHALPRMGGGNGAVLGEGGGPKLKRR